jgi:hypothetical protein
MHYDTIFIVSASDRDIAEGEVEEFLFNEHNYTNDYAVIEEILPLKEEIDKVNRLAKELMDKMVQQESRMRKEDGSYDYASMSEVAEYNQGTFFLYAPFYNVTDSSFLVPDKSAEYWAVTVDQHY